MNVVFRAFIALSLLCVVQTQAQTNGILRQVFSGIAGSAVSDLTNSANYPNNPSSQNLVTDFFESPSNVDDNYGQRMVGYIYPPTTGNYIFWIATDDGGALYISTDETPVNKRLVASVPSWAGVRQWTSFPSQQSSPVALQSGKRYYIEALMKEASGGDNLAVRWQLPSGTIEEPIPASRLTPYGLTAPNIATQPSDQSVAEGGTAVFSVVVANNFAIAYQWQRNGVDISGATNVSVAVGPVTLADNNAHFQARIVNSFGSTNTTAALLTVIPDTTPPTISTVSTFGTTVNVLFSEPVAPAGATNIANFSLNNGAVITAAHLLSDQRTVVLTTSLSPGVVYTLTVNNIFDQASTPNKILANSQRPFSYLIQPLAANRVFGNPEILGPSSRRTPLVISEIMYHPAARTDLKNAEYIEIYNSQAWTENISGFRLTGDIDYTFPSNTTIAAGAFIVVAAVPADVQSIYGISGVLGPYQKSLSNGSGEVMLLNNLGAVFLDARFSGKAPYPPAADGAGHSLVLWRPSYGEGNPEAWAASDRMGGSPGGAESQDANIYRGVVINEILAHTDDPQVDFVELYNYGSTDVDLSGAILTDDASTNKYLFPAGTKISAGGFVSRDQNQLGFSLSASGETIYFIASGRARVVDALRFGPQENGVSYGRYPDGAPAFRRLRSVTPSASNTAPIRSPVVINEIMYHPLDGNDDQQFVELYNRTTTNIDISNWGLKGGVGYTFPSHTVLAANDYAVVARNASYLISLYTNLSVAKLYGNFDGKLSKSRGTVMLTKPDNLVTTNKNGIFTTNSIDVAVDEVDYRTGGRWGTWSDGGGSSLELVDAHADGGVAPNWADSDETAKSGWVTIETTGVLDNGNGTADSLQILMEGAGECLVDDVQVLLGGVNLITNPSFETGIGDWFPQGNHNDSGWENNGYNSGHSLHVRSTGRGDTGANRIRTALSSTLNSGATVTIRAHVRWLSGASEILFRLHGNWLESFGTSVATKNFGTPGARNSRALSNAGPAIHDVTHFPALPAANQAVTIVAQVGDADDLSLVRVNYRLDPDTNIVSAPMLKNGAGFYSAILPGQPANSEIAYSIEAVDNSPDAARSIFPNNAPARECLIRFGDTISGGTFAGYHLWMTQGTVNTWANREKNSNKLLDATFVYNNDRVIYNMGTMYSGSPWHTPGFNSPVGNICDYIVIFPDDDLLLGATDFVIATVGNDDNDTDAQHEQTAFWMMNQLGVPSNYRRYVHMYVNNLNRAKIYEDAQQPGGDLVDSYFPDDAKGDLHKIEDWFEFDNTGDNHTLNVDASLQNFTTTGGVKKIARYRWNWRKRAVKDSANDYTDLMNLVDALNNTDSTKVQTLGDTLMDVDEWMRVEAVEHIVGNWDSFGYERGKNMYAYKPQNGKWVLLPWDIDFVLGLGGREATAYPFNGIEPVLQRLWTLPLYRRAFLRALTDAVNGPLVPANVTALVDPKYAALLANGVGVNSPSDPNDAANILTFVTQRQAYLQSVLATNTSPFGITINNGADFSTSSNLVTLTGTAPVTVKTIVVNGVAYPVFWNTLFGWSVKIPMQSGTNALSVSGYDLRSNVVAGASSSIRINYTGVPALPEQNVIINEVMYNPTTAGGEFIELYNRSTTTAFDLSGYVLQGADFTFPAGTIITPLGYLVVAKDRDVFTQTYGAVPLAGIFSGSLNNGGELIRLRKPPLVNGDAGATISAVRYDNKLPWPTNAVGVSLQVRDVTQDVSRVENWSVSGSGAGAQIPEWRLATVTGVAPTSLLYIYLNSAGDAYIDDLKLVAGSVAEAGPNLIADGDFETPLASSFTVSANQSASTISTANKYSGNSSLHIIASAGGTTASSAITQTITPALSSTATYTLSFRYLATSNGPSITIRLSNATAATGIFLSLSTSLGTPTLSTATPGAVNSVAASLPAIPSLWINELQPNNVTGPMDRLGHHGAWLELFNSGTATIDLSNDYMTDNMTNLTQWRFPSGTSIAGGRYLLVWMDGALSISTNSEPHASFILSQGSGTVALVHMVSGKPTVLDYVDYNLVGPDRSYGSYPDGQSIDRQYFVASTPAAPNDAKALPITVFINEWMASNVASLPDPADGHFDDWFELYNAGTNTVDLSGYYLTDTLTNKTQWKVPNGTVIPSKGYLLVWADNDTGQNGFNTDLHANFKLANTGEAIGLFAPDGTPIDQVTFGAQTADVSQGRVTDGVSQLTFFTKPTPRAANQANATTNHPPVITTVFTNTTVIVSNLVTFTLNATDGDLPANVIHYTLDPGAPLGATMDLTSGQFSWRPTQTGTFAFVVRATDDGIPPLSDSRNVTFTVIAAPLTSFSIAAGKVSGGQFTLSWQTQAGSVYRLQSRTSLSSGAWTQVGTDTTATGSVMTFSEAVGGSQKYYRVVQVGP